MDLFKEKTSTLADFQRIRGMLRLLSRAVAQLWADRPARTRSTSIISTPVTR